MRAERQENDTDDCSESTILDIIIQRKQIRRSINFHQLVFFLLVLFLRRLLSIGDFVLVERLSFMEASSRRKLFVAGSGRESCDFVEEWIRGCETNPSQSSYVRGERSDVLLSCRPRIALNQGINSLPKIRPLRCPPVPIISALPTAKIPARLFPSSSNPSSRCFPSRRFSHIGDFLIVCFRFGTGEGTESIVVRTTMA